MPVGSPPQVLRLGVPHNCFLVPGFSVLEVPDSRDIVDNVNALASAVRSGGGLVVWINLTEIPQNSGE